MNKTYIQPSISIVEVKLQQMIAVSGDANPQFDTTGESNTMDSRRHHSLWDEDEEEF